MLLCFFFFNDTATTEIYTLSLHDALPICSRRRRARRNRNFFRFPLPIVPLADKASPILNVQIDGLAADTECRLLIAVSRSGHDVHAIEMAGWQRERLAFRDQGIGGSFCSRTKLETNAVILQSARQHLRGQRASLRVESRRRFRSIGAGRGEVVRERNCLRD